MPELPEVEAIARLLLPLVRGRRIRRCRVIHPVVVGGPAAVRAAQRVAGRRVTGVERRGKYLLLLLDRGCLAMHFRLSGQVVWYDPRRPPPHVDVALDFPAGTLGFVDPRHLGKFRWLPRPGALPGIAAMGVDPLSRDFNVKRLAALLHSSRRPVKLLLMDQNKIAGLGNIWSCEALWRARIDPRRPAARLTPAETRRLTLAIVAVLRRALKSCLDPAPDFRDPDWWFQGADRFLRVYDREGRPCRRCGARIRRIRQGGRSTYFCGGCQRNA